MARVESWYGGTKSIEGEQRPFGQFMTLFSLAIGLFTFNRLPPSGRDQRAGGRPLPQALERLKE